MSELRDIENEDSDHLQCDNCEDVLDEDNSTGDYDNLCVSCQNGVFS